jgi:hypothetical protein
MESSRLAKRHADRHEEKGNEAAAMQEELRAKRARRAARRARDLIRRGELTLVGRGRRAS